MRFPTWGYNLRIISGTTCDLTWNAKLARSTMVQLVLVKWQCHECFICQAIIALYFV